MIKTNKLSFFGDFGRSVEVTAGGGGSMTNTKSETHETNWNIGFSNIQGSVNTNSENKQV